MFPILIVVGVIVTVGVLAFSIYALRSETEAAIEDRLDRYTSDYGLLIDELEAAERDEKEQAKREEQSAVTRVIDKAIEKRGFAANWRDQLARADLKLTPGEFLGTHILTVIVGFLFGYGVLLQGNIVVGIAMGAFGFFVPRMYLSVRKGRRIKQFENQLPDTIGLWVNGLRAGYSVQQAMEAIGREGPDPTAMEFRRVVQELQLGVPRDVALNHLLNRMPSEDLDLIITAVDIQAEVGGNLAEILDIIGVTIRERIKLKGEIGVLTAQGRITGYVIGGLPVFLGGVLMLIAPSYMGRMFSNQSCGWPMLFCAVSLVGSGFAAINKIVTIDI